MIQREFTEEINYDTLDELKEDFIAHKLRYGDKLEIIQSQLLTQDKKIIYHYWGEQPPQPGPKQLPPHIEATYSLTLESDQVNEISEVLNHVDQYYPGMKLFSYGITQLAGEPATAMICLVNYDPPEEETPQDIDEQGDIDVL